MMYSLIGTLAAVAAVAAYMLLISRKIGADDYSYLVSQAVISSSMLISLYDAFNIGAVIINVFWLLITLSGIWGKYNRSFF